MTDIASIIEANRQNTLRNIKLYAPQLVQLIDEADENDTDAIAINRTMADDILAMFTPFEAAVREIQQLRAEYQVYRQTALTEADLLRTEVSDQQAMIDSLMSEIATLSDRSTCGDCGRTLEPVRPGKHQCNYCELVEALDSLLRERGDDQLSGGQIMSAVVESHQHSFRLGYEKGEALEGEVERLNASWTALYDETRAEVKGYMEALRLRILETDLLRERLREVGDE